MEGQDHLNAVSEILYTMKLFDKVPDDQSEGRTILQFNGFNSKKFSKEEQNLIGHMLHTFCVISTEALVTAGKSGDNEEIDKWKTLLGYCQDTVIVWYDNINRQ